MDFDLSKPQKMLQDSVKEFLSRHCNLERVREESGSLCQQQHGVWG